MCIVACVCVTDFTESMQSEVNVVCTPSLTQDVYFC